MSRLAGAIDGVIGVGTDRDTLAAAATDPVGGLLAQTSVSADAAGYRHLFDFAQARCPAGAAGRWRVPAATAPGWPPSCMREVSGGRGRPAQAATAAHRGQERRPGRRPRSTGGARPRPSAWAASPWRPGSAAGAAGYPPQRLRGQVSATNQLKALIIGAPEELRAELRGLATKRQVVRCARLRDRPARSLSIA